MGGPAPPPAPSVDPIDLSNLPTDPGELHEYLRKTGIEVTAAAAVLTKRLVEQLASTDLSKTNPRDLANAIATLTKRLGEVSALLADIAPRTIEVKFTYPWPTADGRCPICGEQREDKDVTGFDEPEDDG